MAPVTIAGVTATIAIVLFALASGSQSETNDDRLRNQGNLAALLEELEKSAASSQSSSSSARGADVNSDPSPVLSDAGEASGSAVPTAARADLKTHATSAETKETAVKIASSVGDDDEAAKALLSRLDALDSLLRQTPDQATAANEPVRTRGFDRHGRILSQPAVPDADRSSRPTKDAIVREGDGSDVDDADPSSTLSLLARLLQSREQMQQTSEQSSGRVVAAGAPDAAASKYGGPPSDAPTGPSASDRARQQQLQSDAGALLRLAAIVRDVVVEEQGLREETENALDTVVAIAALEAKQRAASERRLLGGRRYYAAAEA